MTNKDIFKKSTYKSLQEQVGGKHYYSMKIQPARVYKRNKLLFAGVKGKEEDIKKAF